MFYNHGTSLQFVSLFNTSQSRSPMIDTVSYMHCPNFVFMLKLPDLAEELSLNYTEFITKTCPCNVYPIEPHFYITFI